jgi:hypothetical protein
MRAARSPCLKPKKLSEIAHPDFQMLPPERWNRSRSGCVRSLESSDLESLRVITESAASVKRAANLRYYLRLLRNRTQVV